ncbi:MAG: hypothetical protein AUJ92_12595 [Armatimonadetes bacterium CG2_30_59_28]|nr:hypothetical protein [Armatimonadota bacterium]OIO93340.1 MAG: hypothetical protein AUJ92_12595 [Armatimonadetes bacterium CG2_30_59_28]PIU66301.1 MAG: hypothetical protein COS85_05480 [Armatimonadetes bacterium CG07_land_8_20_14_0_80_59_28]PJB71533.1 MAG: hypothetical protein CO095_07970 [Armatimonadetes bacterium CG_4_9_14_3_um_filter_58_7]
MAFEALKEIERWLTAASDTESSPLADRDEFLGLLASTEDGDLGVMADWLTSQPQATDPQDVWGGIRARYALAEIKRRAGQSSESSKGFIEVARAMIDLNRWEDVRELALRGLTIKADYRFVRLILKSWDHLPASDQKQADVEYALGFLPEDPALLFHESRRLDALGNSPDATRLACKAFEGFVAHKELNRAEEALWRALEDETAQTGKALLSAIPLLVRQGAVNLLNTLVEFASPLVDQFALHPHLAAGLEVALSSSQSDFASLRHVYVAALLKSLRNEGELDALVRKSGLADEANSFPVALRTFQGFCRYRPGTVVEHRSWGRGQVKKNDGETVVADLENRPGHRMSFEMAESSLTAFPEDSIRSLLYAHPDVLEKEKTDDPVALILRVLHEHSNEMATREIKTVLAGDVIPESEWSGWWSSARKLLEADSRVDPTRAFEQIYALATEGTVGEVDLPSLDTRHLRRCVTTVRKFLKQHPAMKGRAVQRYGPPLSRAAERSEGEPLLHVLPLLAEWYPERRQEWIHLAEEGYQTGGRTTSVTSSEDQETLLNLGLQGGASGLAAFTAVASRFPSVRDAGMAQLSNDGSPSNSELVWKDRALTLIEAHLAFPKEGVALIQTLLSGDSPASFAQPWDGVLAGLHLLAGRLTTDGDAGLWELLRAEGLLSNRLVDTECPTETRESIRAVLFSGRIRMQELAKVVEFFASAGETDLADEISRHLSVAATAAAEDTAGDINLDFAYMTRSAYDAGQRQLRDLERELRVEIPEAIQKARELGDLSENAEYHAARERQGIVSSQFLSLRDHLIHAKCIEDIEIPEGFVWPGTEVVLLDGTEDVRVTFWILGEGDDPHGPEVISYESPIGRSLLGKKTGEQVEILHEDSPVLFSIASIKRRLPSPKD